jgi:hypothetical protein
LIGGQDELSSGHLFFQLQTSLLTESFDDLMDRLGAEAMPYLSRGVDDFNELHDTTEESLEEMNAHPSCFDDCERIHLRHSREQSRCADGLFIEMSWLMYYHTTYAFISEYYSNMVILKGIDIFRSWRPLTDPDLDEPVSRMKLALRDHIDEYFRFDYASMTSLADYVEDQFDSLASTMYFCNYSLLGRYYTATNQLLEDAMNGQCSGQV